MHVVALLLVLVVALLHAYFLVLEMFLWTKPIGLKTFGLTPAFAEESRSLAANQGLYNGFLVAGLLWGVIASFCGPGIAPSAWGIELFFLACVIVAGVFGAITVGRRILFVQALPAAIALVCVLLAGPT